MQSESNHREDSALIPGLKSGDFPFRPLRSCELKHAHPHYLPPNSIALS